MLLVQSSDDDRQISVLRFPDLAHMQDYDETVIWRPRRGSDHAKQVWAPELHNIGWRWYVYYAASNGENRNHRAYVLEADNPFGPFTEKGRIFDPENDSWAIDLTVLRHERRLYAVWSGWDAPDDGFPQNIYIAPMSNPWTISGPRVLISRPEHDWETSVRAINEGPQVLVNPDGKLLLTYSADASWTTAYKVGLLEFVGDDVLDPASWRKLPGPIITGGGHGCFVEEAGQLYAVYHRKLTPDPGWADRVIQVLPVGWDSSGYPVVGRLTSSATRTGDQVPGAQDTTPRTSFGPQPLG
jgi:GH43 family beta-xylosidase